MSARRRRVVGRVSRFVMLGVGLALAGMLAVSFSLSDSGIDDAEATAEQRAERFAEAFLIEELTPDLVARDIDGTEYRDLLIAVQAGILSDHRVVRVRIWKAGGDLIFSTAQRDKVDEFFARDDEEITRASTGETVSVSTDDTVPPVQGLEGADEKLFETYVPLVLDDQSAPYPVAQIDQRYSTIEDAANRVWNLVQMLLILALVGFAGVAVIALRSTPGAEPPVDRSRVAREVRERREEEARALAAEHAARQADAGQRLALADERIRSRSQPDVPTDVRRQLEAAELRLRAVQTEREELAGEVLRLRAALTEKEAELSLEREGSVPQDRAETKRIERLETAVKEAEAEAERLRALLADAERSRDDGVAKLVEIERAHQDGAAKLAEAERSRGELVARLADADRARDEIAVRLADAERAIADREEPDLVAALEEARAAAEDAKAEARRAKEDAAAATADGEGIRAELARAVFEAERLQDELERRGVDIERMHAELDAALAEVSRLKQERVAAQDAGAEPGEPRSARRRSTSPDLEALTARVAEMETQRRQEVVELQRAQESLANTQFELLETTRKLREAEERVRALEGGTPAAAEPSPRPRPTPRRRKVAAEPAPEPEPVWSADVATAEPEPARAPEPEPVAASGQTTEDEEDLSGLSLRERLARAAAARHRTGPGA